MFIYCQLVILILFLTFDGHGFMRVFGYREAVPHSRPYMVLLEIEKNNSEKKYCAGFLLTEDVVMTAAHCQGRSYTALLGLHDIHKSDEIQRMSVEQAFPHRHFIPTNYTNDIMLLKLSSKVTFNNNVQPIALASRGACCLPKSCIVSGWGRTDGSRYMSSVLREVEVELIDNEQCTKENLYCSEGDTGPAVGDGGAPLVCEDGQAYGVVSFNIIPASGGPQISCYTKIPDQRSWIHSIMIGFKGLNTCYI